MSSRTATLTVALKDLISKPAKAAASSLKSIDAALRGVKGGDVGALDRQLKKLKALDQQAATSAKSIKAATAVLPARDFSASFKEAVGNLKLSRRELRSLAREAVKARGDLEKTLASIGNPKIRAQLIEKDLGGIESKLLDKAKRLRRERDLQDALTRSVNDTSRAHVRARRVAGSIAGTAGAAIGVGGAAYAGRRAVSAVARQGAASTREGARDYLAGLTPEDEARIRVRAGEVSKAYPSIDATTMHERLRDTALSMGSVEKAMKVADTIGRMTTVLQSLKGKDAALEEGRSFFKALDNLGHNLDPDEVRRYAHGYTKALGVEGADMKMSDLFEMAKYAKSGGAALSEKFLTTVAPSLMQDLGPNRLGTALGSSVSQVIGGRATKASKAAQQQMGLRDRRGNFLDSSMIMSDPFQYTLERLIPALKKKGVNVDDSTAVTKATSQLFSNQMVADLFTKMITQRDQYQRKTQQYDRAPGLDAAPTLPARDPYVAAAGVVSQFNNALAALADPFVPSAVAALNSLSSTLGDVAKTVRENPETTKNLIGTHAPVATSAAAWLTGWVTKTLAGSGGGFFSNLLGKVGTGAEVAGRVGTRALGPITLLKDVLDFARHMGSQYGYREASGPGSKSYAKAVRKQAEDRAAAANDGFGGERDAAIARERAAQERRDRYAETWGTGGSLTRKRLTDMDSEIRRLQQERYDMEERRRESSRARGRMGMPLPAQPSNEGTPSNAPLPPERPASITPKTDTAPLEQLGTAADATKEKLSSLSNVTVAPQGDTSGLTAITAAANTASAALDGLLSKMAQAKAQAGSLGAAVSASSGRLKTAWDGSMSDNA